MDDLGANEEQAVGSAAALADYRTRPSGGVTVARALGSSTRAAIFAHLQETQAASSVREIAATFDLHPNVARTHLETLADAGLVEVGRRKHPGGGRPAKVYRARADVDVAPEQAEVESPSEAMLVLVRLLAALVDDRNGDAALLRAAHDSAAREARRLVAAVGAAAAASPGDLGAAAQLAVRALRGVAPRARIVRTGDGWVDVAAVGGTFDALEETRPGLAEALERGLLAGAFEAAGAPATLADAGTDSEGDVTWRARAVSGASSRLAAPASTVDVRGQQRESGVVQAMRAVTGMRRGEVLEVLTEGPGSPAAFARWADRAGHELLGVERAVDGRGRVAIRLLIRKGA